uniref:Uncharacterized protein n=1 Tax=Anguilla anguilla TaxID=7936 RepID=A0A0E9WC25_ANGAN
MFTEAIQARCLTQGFTTALPQPGREPASPVP